MFKNLFYKKILLIFSCFLTIFLVFNVFARDNLEFFEPYANLLTNHVSYSTVDGVETTVVDYNMWKFDIDYPKAMNFLERANPEQLKDDEKMAFWINAYNLLAIDLVIRGNEAKSIKKIGGLFKDPFKSYKWQIGGKEYNLDTIKNEILRKMNDPRIHFATISTAISGPDLMKKPYSFEKLNSQLRWQTILFLGNKDKGIQFLSKNSIKISEIFKQFKEDFGGEIELMEFLMSHNHKVNEKTTIDGYIKYNWKLNKL
jgi:hypothetical protein